MSRLYLVRHAETIWHKDNRYAGLSDVPLTPRGREQAEQLAEWAAVAGPSSIWSSPLARARHTAEPSARALGLPLQVDERLRELDFGRGDGMTGAEMEAAFPAERAAFLRDPAAHPLPGGEPPAHAAERGAAALDAIAALTLSGQTALVIVHSTLVRLILCRALAIPLSRYRSVFPHIGNVRLIELDWRPQRAGLLGFNLPITRPHLEPQP